MNLDWSSRDSLIGLGFQGFTPIAQLMADSREIPAVRGVYVLLRESAATPAFLEVGTGGHFKGKDPNVPLSSLLDNWIPDAPVIYIGKAGDPGPAATLRSRLRQYLRFGAGANVGHWGGRYIWQLADVGEVRMAWLPLPDGFPSQMESELIQEFRLRYGSRPFANLTK